jgi:lipopolysaccharide transport system ATP-binding protein
MIRATNVHVEFPIFNTSHRSFKKAVIRASTGGRISGGIDDRVVVSALEDVSLEINEGERVGLLGHNGSGKTTLLRVLAGIYEPVRGCVVVQGPVTPLLDLSLGMDHEATGRENIRLRATLMGLPRPQIETRIDGIIEFSELGSFIDVPIRTYSSGMLLRLAFAVSTAVRPGILLMDEWLSVGDAGFRDKAAARLMSLIESSSILIFASHDQNMIKRFCNRTIRLEHGRIIEDVKLSAQPEQAAA